MQKQLKKFGFFLSNNNFDKHSLNNIDGPSEKSQRKVRKVKESEQLKKPKKYHDDGEVKLRKSKKESEHRKHCKHGSETEIFVNSSEKKKKHSQKHKEKFSEDNRSRKCEKDSIGKRKFEDAAKLITRDTKLRTSKPQDDLQWLNKKEIFKLLCHSQYGSPDLLKKLLMLDKPKLEEISEKYAKKLLQANKEEIPLILPFMKPSKSKQKNSEIDVVFTRQARKHRRELSPMPKAHSHMEYIEVSPTRTRIKRTKDDLVLSDSTSTSKDTKLFLDNRKKSKKELLTSLAKLNRTNPERHNKCLVKHTFSVVKIPPLVDGIGQTSVEKKKKSKAFQHYYNYDTNAEIRPNPYDCLSDSNKIYQDCSERSIDGSSKRKSRNSGKRRQLKTETHVSTVISNSSSKKIKSNVNDVKKNKKEKSDYRSKIPILSKHQSKVQETPSVRDFKKKIVSTFKENSKNTEESDVKAKKPKSHSSNSKHQKDKVCKHESKISNTSSKHSKKLPEMKLSSEEKGKIQSFSPQSTYRKPSKECIKSKMSKMSNDGSVWSKSNSRRSCKSDTKLQPKGNSDRKVKTMERSSTKGSFSNSTVGSKSVDSSRKPTSFLLTKSYRDDDKLTRWQKRKIYADTVRKNLYNKNQKVQIVPPKVLEVHYLTVSHDNPDLTIKDSKVSIKSVEKKVELTPEPNFFTNDLPESNVGFLQNPLDEALNEILSENYNFLKKDFSYCIEKLTSSSDEMKSPQISMENFKKSQDWFNVRMAADVESLSDISQCKINSVVQEREEDNLIDSCSAPSSEESGYATVVKCSEVSKDFFSRPSIKALLHPLPSYHNCIVQTEEQCSTSRKCKSLQTMIIKCSQKSIQIQEDIDFSVEDGKEDVEQESTEILVETKQKRGVIKNIFLCCFSPST